MISVITYGLIGPGNSFNTTLADSSKLSWQVIEGEEVILEIAQAPKT